MKGNEQITWSIGRKLITGFAAVLLLTIIVGATNIYALNTVKTDVEHIIGVDVQLEALSNQIGISILQGLQAKSDFLVNYKIIGFDAAQAEANELMKSEMQAIRDAAAAGSTLENSEGNKEDAVLFEKIGAWSEDFEQGFVKVVAFVERQGYGDAGLTGQLRARSESIEQTVEELNSLDEYIMHIRLAEGNYLIRGDQNSIDLMPQLIAQFKGQIDTTPIDALSNAQKTDLKSQIDEYLTDFEALVQLDNESSAALEQLEAEIEAIKSDNDKLQAKAEADLARAAVQVDETIRLADIVEIVSLSLAIIVGFAIAVVLSRSISQPVGQLTDAAIAIAGGDLTRRADISSRDELKVMATAFNQMTDNLRQRIETEKSEKEGLEQTVDQYLTFIKRVGTGDLTARLSLNGHGQDDAVANLGQNLNSMVQRLEEMTSQIRLATVNITASAAEIMAATAQQASSANEQSSAISQTTTTIDEVKTIVEQSFAKAQSVAEQAQRTRDVSQSGQHAVIETVSSMNQIKERVEGIAENILALSEQTQQIGEITATVNDIASQSNMLALNASVEAARAGEHGKGFAVVAVEVRNLAEQSKQATAQVKAILNEIQHATNAAVMATEEGTKGVDLGVKLTQQAGTTIQQLDSSIAESANAAQQIVASAQQQTTGMEQIALAMDNINQATVQNVSSTRQAERAAQDLAAVAQQLEDLVSRYKLSDMK